MVLEWDEQKDQTNIKKHGISFARAATIFAGKVLSCRDVRKHYGETRMQSIGQIISGEEKAVVILVAHTGRKGVVRIISARPANKKERRRYYGYIEETQ